MKDLVQLKGNFKKQSGSLNVDAIAKALEDAYLQSRRPAKFTQKKSFAPSGVGYGNGKCPRYWWYMFNGIDTVDDNDAVSIANMAYGTEAHARIQGLFEKAGILVDAERPLENQDPPIFGFMDAMIDVDGEHVVCEIKTTKQEAFMIREAKRTPPGYHLIQILIYMKLTDSTKGFLLYENKNTGELLVLPVYMDDANTKIVDEAFEWMKVVYEQAKHEIPQRPFTRSSPACKYCPLAEVCWDGYTKAVKTRGVVGVDPNPGTVLIPPLEVPA